MRPRELSITIVERVKCVGETGFALNQKLHDLITHAYLFRTLLFAAEAYVFSNPPARPIHVRSYKYVFAQREMKRRVLRQSVFRPFGAGILKAWVYRPMTVSIHAQRERISSRAAEHRLDEPDQAIPQRRCIPAVPASVSPGEVIVAALEANVEDDAAADEVVAADAPPLTCDREPRGSRSVVRRPVLRRHIADRAVQSHRVVVIHVGFE